MAADGTYYWPAAGYFRPDEGGKRWQNSLLMTLTGGSGTATATLEASTDPTFSSPVDVTAITGVYYWVAHSGVTRNFWPAFTDINGELFSFPYLRVKIVLDTGGADDGDYEVVLIRK